MLRRSHAVCILLLFLSSTAALRPLGPHSHIQSFPRTALTQRTSACRTGSTSLCASQPDRKGHAKWITICSSNSFRVVSATLLIVLDITFYTFPLPFLGDHILRSGRTPAEYASLVAAFTYSGLVAGLAILVREIRRVSARTPRQRMATLAGVACIMAAGSAAQAILPSYSVLCGARLLQGGATQVAWSTALATAATLGPVAGVKPTAWIMAGNSVGEVIGPQFGARFFSMGGVRLPFAVASGLAALLAVALGSTASSLPREPAPPPSSSTGPSSSSRRSPLRDRPTLLLCGLIALTCGTVRSLLDALLPLTLRSLGFGVAAISNTMLAAALLYVLGTTATGCVLAHRPAAAQGLLAFAAVASTFATAAVLLPSTALGVAALFCAYFLLSSVVGVAVTSAFEERGRILGNMDDVMALQVFAWTSGFSLGGALSVIAAGGAASIARQRLTLGVVSAINLVYCLCYMRSADKDT